MTRTGFATGLGCLAACSGLGAADILVDVGCFSNINPIPSCSYEGDFEDHVSTTEVEGYTSTLGYTMIDIDLGGILASVGGGRLTGISIVDFGDNTYGSLSPGADIDYVGITGLDPGVTVQAGYGGTTGAHAGETPDELWARLDTLDAFYGANHLDDAVYVSLGQHGVLDLSFIHAGVPDDGEGSGGPGGPGPVTNPWGSLATYEGLRLQLVEVGTHERFSVHLHVTGVPAPPGLLVAVGGLGMIRRRRH